VFEEFLLNPARRTAVSYFEPRKMKMGMKVCQPPIFRWSTGNMLFSSTCVCLCPCEYARGL
jgi:hypothetical protein